VSVTDSEPAAAVRQALADIEVPGGGTLADHPGLSEIVVTASAIAFAISIEPGMEKAFGPVLEAARAAVAKAVPDKKPLISLTADAGGTGGTAGAPRESRAAQAGRRAPPPSAPVPGISRIVTVASGKGGVGKSTTAVNLALALAESGRRVGILDADIYGPSLPKMLGIEDRPAVRADGIFKPHEAFGLKVMSIGSMVEPGQAIVWRGPMATAALRQLLRETEWGELDILVVDLPPGTGDVHISICQQVPLAGAVIVSTPQDLALIDARKAVDMFNRLAVPVLGIVENMSYFVAPDTGQRYDIFGQGGAETEAKALAVPFLGAIPLDIAIRQSADTGQPVVAAEPESAHARAFRDIAAVMLAQPAFTEPAATEASQ
jgi:ATP-binding protein involved in chromosome partitioning